jgi:uncharacterized protein (TIGR03437 family)
VIRSLGNAASYASNAISPGEIVAIFGTGLGPDALSTLTLGGDGIVSKELAGTIVKFNGIAAPLIYTSSGAVACTVPYAIGGSFIQVTVSYLGVTSDAFTIPAAAAAPGIFTVNSAGSGQAEAFNQDYSINSAGNPATTGSVITIYATGEGLTDPAAIDGKPATTPLAAPLLPVTATIGGKNAAVAYAGAAPGLIAGTLQVNLVVPDSVSGPAVPVVIRVGDASSQTTATIAITGALPGSASRIN